MNNKRRKFPLQSIFRYLLTGFLCVSLATVAAEAEGPAVTFGTDAPASLKAGDTFKITVSSASITGAYGLSIKVQFDKFLFEVTELDWNTAIPIAAASEASDANRNGFFATSFTDLSTGSVLQIPDNTVYVTATLKVKDGAASGSSVIQLIDFKPYDVDSKLLPVSANTSELTVSINGGAASSGGSGSTSAAGTAASAAASDDTAGKLKVTYYGGNGTVLSEQYVNPGDALPEQPLGYQYAKQSSVSENLEMKPINVTDDGYVVVNTLAGKTR